MPTTLQTPRHKITHDNPITIDEALQTLIPEHDEAYETIDEGRILRGLILCSNEEHGFFFTETESGQEYFTLQELHNAGYKQIILSLEYFIEPENEKELRS